MSHLKERKEKICLNCQAELVGRYCHLCGQENLEPKETVWHLVQHFFNDITHFDGKFFETVKYLMRKPGFLSLEYMAGRRMSYLNPIRMYVFTSAIFFIILFSIKRPEDMVHETKDKGQTVTELKAREVKLNKEIATEKDEDDREDEKGSLQRTRMELGMIRKLYGDSTPKSFSKAELGDLLVQAYTDSLRQAGLSSAERNRIDKVVKAINTPNSGLEVFGMRPGDFRSVEEYDSSERALPDSLRDGWLERTTMHRLIKLNEDYHEDPRRFKEHLIENVFHSFPKILFVSLPIFAMLLNILYFRHKQYLYVNHGIFTIHFYCGTFILLMIAILLQRLMEGVGWSWLRIVLGILIFATWVYMLIYLYKAMRGFYRQRRAKTFLKYFIVFSTATIINMIIFAIFMLISVISI